MLFWSKSSTLSPLQKGHTQEHSSAQCDFRSTHGKFHFSKNILSSPYINSIGIFTPIILKTWCSRTSSQNCVLIYLVAKHESNPQWSPHLYWQLLSRVSLLRCDVAFHPSVRRGCSPPLSLQEQKSYFLLQKRFTEPIWPAKPSPFWCVRDDVTILRELWSFLTGFQQTRALCWMETVLVTKMNTKTKWGWNKDIGNRVLLCYCAPPSHVHFATAAIYLNLRYTLQYLHVKYSR